MSADFVSYPHGIATIDTYYIKKDMAAAHLLVENGAALFVDVGPTPACPRLLAGLDSAGLTPEDVRYIVVTHIHLDHAGGAAALMKHCSRATLLVHPRGASHMIDPGRLIDASVAIYGQELFAELYGEIDTIDENRVQSVSDGWVLDFAGRPLHFFDTPGHARHHCCVWDPKSRGVFCGDTFGLAYPHLQTDPQRPFLIPVTAPAAFEPDALISSINRMLELEPETLYLTHFGPIPAHPESIRRLIELIDLHGRLVDQELDIAAVSAQLMDTFFDAYCNSGTPRLSREQFQKFLAVDVKINAQGIAARRARLQKQKR